MSASVGQVQRPPQRDPATAKARRQKTIAIVGVVVLAAVLAIQVPRTLKMLDSGGGGAPTAAAVPAAAPAPTRAPATAGKADAATKTASPLGALLRSHASDPFSSRLPTGSDPAPRVVSGPAGVHDPFNSGAVVTESALHAVSGPAGLRDPFAKTGTAPPPIKRIVIGTPGKTPGKNATAVGYIVVLASIPLDQGQAVATRFAAQVRARGIRGVGVLNSSSRRPLRHGYWVVYIGSYKTVTAAETAAVRVRGLGYDDAYLRQLVRYG